MSYFRKGQTRLDIDEGKNVIIAWFGLTAFWPSVYWLIWPYGLLAIDLFVGLMVNTHGSSNRRAIQPSCDLRRRILAWRCRQNSYRIVGVRTCDDPWKRGRKLNSELCHTNDRTWVEHVRDWPFGICYDASGSGVKPRQITIIASRSTKQSLSWCSRSVHALLPQGKGALAQGRGCLKVSSIMSSLANSQKSHSILTWKISLIFHTWRTKFCKN